MAFNFVSVKFVLRMLLNNLSILNYKNIAEAQLQFCPGINCFVGDNGVGKTNILDSIYYLACTKSRSGLIDAQVVRHGEQMFILEGDFTVEAPVEDNVKIQAGYKTGSRKSFKKAGKEYQRLADHIGLIPIVIVSPSDSSLISDFSDNRRRFIDFVISQYSKEYLLHLIKYNKLLQQRNSMLKQQIDDATMYEVCEAQMAASGNEIYKARRQFISEFARVFNTYYKKISDDKESVALEYKSQLDDGNFEGQLSLARRVDMILGHTTKGIHKDDLEMMLGGWQIRKTGSQGQCKSYLLALKFAEFEYLKRITGRTPMLLLDDIFDKLDASRVEQIIKIVSSGEFGQIFITDTNRTNLDTLLQRSANTEFKMFTVENGNIIY